MNRPNPNNYLCESCGLSCDGTFINSQSSIGHYDDRLTIIQKMKQMCFPLIEKDTYFICRYCENIISKVYSENIHLKSSTNPGKSEYILEDITTASENWTHEEELPLHQLALSKFCRVCKSRKFDHVRYEDYYNKNSELILKVCKLISNENFEEEDPNIYPTHLCHKCFLLFSKNCTSLLISQPANKIVCASFPSHKINCEICSTLTEKDLATIQTMTFNKKSSQWTHYEILRKLCRICGCLSGKRHIAKTSDMLQNCMLTLFHFKFENEDPNIYPFFVCNVCASKLNTFCYQKERNMQVSLPLLYKFYPHSDDCNICSRNIKSPDVKKNIVPSSTEVLPKGHIISALYFHKQKLLRFCYICGIPNVQFYGKETGKLKCEEDVVNKINFSVAVQLLDTHIDEENVNPPAICHTCWIKLNINYNLKLKGKHSLIKQFKKFNVHTEKCSICSTSNYSVVSGIPLYYEKIDDKETLKFLSYSTSVKGIEEVLLKTSIKLREANESIVIYGLPFNQLQVSKITEAVACGGCAIVPFRPLLTKCQHIICEHCIKSIFETRHICPHVNCYQLVNPDKVWTSISKLAYISSLTFICKNSLCNFKGFMKVVIKHQLSCTGSNSKTETVNCLTNISKKSSSIATKDTNSSLLNNANIPDNSMKNRTFQNVLPFINKYCDTHQQRKADVFSFLADYYKENKSSLLAEDTQNEDGNKVEETSIDDLEAKPKPETAKRMKLSNSNLIPSDNSLNVEETSIDDLEAKLIPETAKRMKLSNSNLIPSDNSLNVEGNSFDSKIMPSNVWDISSHDGQMSLLNGSIDLSKSKMLLRSKKASEVNSSICCSDLSQDFSEFRVSHLSKSESTPQNLSHDIEHYSEQDEDESHDSSSNLVIFEESGDDLAKQISPSNIKEISSDVHELYLQFSPNVKLPINDDLLSESSSDQEFSDEELSE